VEADEQRPEVRARRARSRSDVQASMAPIQASYCSMAAGTSPFHPWLITKTSVQAPVRSSWTMRSLSFPPSSLRSAPRLSKAIR
jgi:hypothetical protein